ncbi:hypothetical protein [Paractinoplanes rishiriensis]|uniref:Uncharacterized protein n=1 Tax=Paractinoplanes rishiriensis TaxID=1050105 RepID=A0A919N0S7_9ACTN|nr:hypothetical protein [Actinoplanes rishiriensis]GIF00011.1 hypothetical protein Ari01nite_74750 [Actinoplanes rishiriensis]
MTLTLCTDLAAAGWIAGSDLSWQRLVTLGPAGFGAYARLRFLADPAHPGQSENDVDAEDWRDDQLPRLFTLLAAHTATPDDCYFAVWEGFDQSPHSTTDGHYNAPEDPDARPGLAPPATIPPAPTEEPTLPRAATAATRATPQLVLPHRAYWLFRGPLSDVGDWDGMPQLRDAPAAFVWPADRAWCVAHDVDPHYAGIGGTRQMISALTGDPALDAIPIDPAAEQPHYR